MIYRLALENGGAPAGLLYNNAAGRSILAHLRETFNDDGSLEVVPTDDPPAVEAPEPFGAFSLRARLAEVERELANAQTQLHVETMANQLDLSSLRALVGAKDEALIAFFRA